MDNKPLAILYRKELKEYDFGPGHPFRGERYELFMNLLKERLKEDGNYRIIAAEPVDDEELLRISTHEYINFSREYYHAANLGLEYDMHLYRYQSHDNVPVGTPGKIEEAARLVIGQAKMAADLVWTGQYQKAVSVGGGLHHAKRHFGEGFCIYNDVAYTAIYLLEKYGLKKILILDTDAHAGNGTSDYFYGDPRVLLVDLHQDPRLIYPGTGFASDIGTGDGKGYTVNVPLPVGAGDESYALVFKEIVEPVVAEFEPQIIIRNGGSDPHFDDGLTDLGLTGAGFRKIGEKTRDLAEICGGKQIDLIASGYNRTVLPNAWLSLVCGTTGFTIEVPEPVPVPPRYANDGSVPETTKVISLIKKYLGDYWKAFKS